MSITEFQKAKKTFLGFLEARGKSLNTIKNYACDLETFGSYCEQNKLNFHALGLTELESYHTQLQQDGLRPNSRRRKIMTAKTFLRYLSGRTDVSTVGSERWIAPDKVEKPPRIATLEQIKNILENQPETGIGWRNKALIGVLLDTGMLVTEALDLKQKDCQWCANGEALLSLHGKRERHIKVTVQTANALREIKNILSTSTYFFYGYSKKGPNPDRLTSRGVEVLFKTWSKTLKIDYLHPRTLRHMCVVEWLKAGKSEHEIMQFLGLKTQYSFRVYRELVQQTPQVVQENITPKI